jgi:RNA polymerase sigma factor (sigma-70 family)
VPARRRSQSDEALVLSVRRGDEDAFAVLTARYEGRLLWFCRQILRSKEDAEDALQDVFIAAFNAIRADDREIALRPWLYRIARNRCINHLRRATAVDTDSMDDHHADHGRTVVDKVVSRQRFRQLVVDVQALPDAQRTALLLCEVDGFSYDRIALAMGTTVPSVKSLLVRARWNLVDASAERESARNATGRRTATARKRTPARRISHPISYQSARATAMSMT